MSQELTFPLNTQNVAEVMAERDAEIERLKRKAEEEYRSGYADGWHQSFKKSQAEIERLRKEASYLIHTDEDIKAQNIEIERLTEAQMRRSAEAREQIQAKDAEIERLQEQVATLQELRELDQVLITRLRAALEPKP